MFHYDHSPGHSPDKRPLPYRLFKINDRFLVWITRFDIK